VDRRLHLARLRRTSFSRVRTYSDPDRRTVPVAYLHDLAEFVSIRSHDAFFFVRFRQMG
jgi:hypothetical protein